VVVVDARAKEGERRRENESASGKARSWLRLGLLVESSGVVTPPRRIESRSLTGNGKVMVAVRVLERNGAQSAGLGTGGRNKERRK
jgi:hypothetical protein